jgi:transketolase
MDLNNIKNEATRVGFGRGLAKAGTQNPSVVALCADLTESTQMHLFKKEFPKRFFEVGVAEQNLVTVASGMAAMGLVPFASSYGAFSPGRNWEQIRTTICLNNQPVIIVGSHTGLSVGPDGATHQILEDIALMRVLPNMQVFCPMDSLEAEAITEYLAKNPKPSYLRLTRSPSPIINTSSYTFIPKKAQVLLSSKSDKFEAIIFTTGIISAYSYFVVQDLIKSNHNIILIHNPSIKPFDLETLEKYAPKTNLIITIEEHQIAGGFGSLISEEVSKLDTRPKVIRLGIDDEFGESGTVEELYNKHGLSKNKLHQKIINLINQNI